jgi:hypothetical protein
MIEAFLRSAICKTPWKPQKKDGSRGQPPIGRRSSCLHRVGSSKWKERPMRPKLQGKHIEVEAVLLHRATLLAFR